RDDQRGRASFISITAPQGVHTAASLKPVVRRRYRPAADIARSRKLSLKPMEAAVRILAAGRTNIYQESEIDPQAQPAPDYEFDQRDACSQPSTAGRPCAATAGSRMRPPACPRGHLRVSASPAVPRHAYLAALCNLKSTIEPPHRLPRTQARVIEMAILRLP